MSRIRDKSYLSTLVGIVQRRQSTSVFCPFARSYTNFLPMYYCMNDLIRHVKRILSVVLPTVCCLLAAQLHAQQQGEISGLILDIEGQPMVGVTVLVKNTTQGTTSASDGRYELQNLTPGATIVFSFLGSQTAEFV
mgnify:CR=1 FL=1